MGANDVRNRKASMKGGGQYSDGGTQEDTKNEEFAIRESPITVLVESSLHIRVIYHIFVVMIFIFFCDMLIFDFFDRGKITMGLTAVIYGFGDIKRGFRLWLYDQFIIIAFYPMLLIYERLGKMSRKYPVTRPSVKLVGLMGLIAVEVAIAAYPTYDLARKHLAVGSSVTVTCEMFRVMMKIISIATACAPRCLDGTAPLPSFKHYMYFQFAPTLIYRDQYPRTKEIRWGKVVLHFAEVAAIIFYNSFLWERSIVPNWSNYGKQSTVEVGTLIRGIFACILPAMLSFLCGFYCLLHAWLNAWAEMLKFGDRLFYEEWWTASSFSRYYRRWNRVVYCWLRDYIYYPLAPSVGRPLSTFIVFITSAVAHEVILCLSFGFFYPVLLVQFALLSIWMIPLTSGRQHPSFFNLFLWMAFFIGNGMLWSLYPMEYFARKNCPPSEDDSYFIPKSWSCPKVIFKPDWVFQNPLEVE